MKITEQIKDKLDSIIEKHEKEMAVYIAKGYILPHIEDLKELRAMLDKSQVQVKKLEWENVGLDILNSVATPTKQYSIWFYEIKKHYDREHEKYFYVVSLCTEKYQTNLPAERDYFITLEKAKAACQKHYEYFILDQVVVG